MKIECEALALDLDGTLTNNAKKITPRTRSAIGAALDQGIKIILASGRPVLGIKPSAEILGLFKRGGFILAYNGGQIIDCKEDNVIFERLLPPDYYREICSFARSAGLHALTYDENGVVAESDTAAYVIKEAYNNTIPIRKAGLLEEAVAAPVVKFMIVGEPERIASALPDAQRIFSGRINVFLSEPYFMELTFPGIEKASALAFLTEYLGIKQERLVAIGDGLNDIPMLQYSGYAVAMGNAYEEVKEVSDYVTLSNEDDGVAVFLEKFV